MGEEEVNITGICLNNSRVYKKGREVPELGVMKEQQQENEKGADGDKDTTATCQSESEREFWEYKGALICIEGEELLPWDDENHSEDSAVPLPVFDATNEKPFASQPVTQGSREFSCKKRKRVKEDDEGGEEYERSCKRRK
ncbi:hypothetical protein ONS95_009043 [Cadophora gregata]|uniref:uncharacterized protein n=1 Tax=Cadophora gregata TaxID=51156 RepID=UPI0026DCD45F|nr:uncharacterized protein ONS95_009043 [Cadophora gregata]KAK0124057.1 hypothetical protein ONS95_009043 [Cadophora gregata]KAK0130391.1 hypothetical protein ONS96_000911 [Cadophora gregata f. sp. sojae]